MAAAWRIIAAWRRNNGAENVSGMKASKPLLMLPYVAAAAGAQAASENENK